MPYYSFKNQIVKACLLTVRNKFPLRGIIEIYLLSTVIRGRYMSREVCHALYLTLYFSYSPSFLILFIYTVHEYLSKSALISELSDKIISVEANA